MPHIEFLAEPRESGQTVSSVLRKRFALTWRQARQLVEGGHVRVAGFLCSDPAHRVKKMNRVWVREGTVELKAPPPTLPPRGKKAAAVKPPVKATAPKAKPPAETVPAEAEREPPLPARKKPAPPREAAAFGLLPAAVVYSDDTVVVVNKPAGLTTTRSAEDAAEFGPRGRKFLPKTLADLLPVLLGSPSEKVIAVHRLDRDTSGLVVFARTPAAAKKLTEQFRKHTADRRYVALVRGTPVEGRIESMLVQDRGDGRRGSTSKATTAPDARRAVTRVKVKERYAGFALVECRLETGRTHQVRIHLGEAGTPLCGETVYDRPNGGRPLADGSGAARPMLHAARLGFVHPGTGDGSRWEVPPPADFQKTLRALRDKGGEAWEL